MRICRRPARICVLLPIAVVLGGCGGRTVGRATVQGLIVDLPDGVFGRDDISIDSISALGGNHAVAEARLRAALRLERVKGAWVIREVRLGKRPWEKIDDIVRALEAVKSSETRKLLEQVASALDKYRDRHGALPRFDDYVSLSDALAPEFLNPVVREDAWQHPLAAFRASADTIRLVSAGPDGKLGSGDDIEVVRTYRQQ